MHQANFEAVHRALREGGRGVAKLSLVRQARLQMLDDLGLPPLVGNRMVMLLVSVLRYIAMFGIGICFKNP